MLVQEAPRNRRRHRRHRRRRLAAAACVCALGRACHRLFIRPLLSCAFLFLYFCQTRAHMWPGLYYWPLILWTSSRSCCYINKRKKNISWLNKRGARPLFSTWVHWSAADCVHPSQRQKIFVDQVTIGESHTCFSYSYIGDFPQLLLLWFSYCCDTQRRRLYSARLICLSWRLRDVS